MFLFFSSSGFHFFQKNFKKGDQIKPLGKKNVAHGPGTIPIRKKEVMVSLLPKWHTSLVAGHATETVPSPAMSSGDPGSFNLKAQPSCSSCFVSFCGEFSLLPISRNLVQAIKQ